MPKYNIGVIGVCNIGSALAKHLVSLGHSVVIAHPLNQQTLLQVEHETGAKAVHISESIKDIVIITVPFEYISHLPKYLFESAPKETVFIDANNYFPELRDTPIELLDKNRLTHSEWVSQTLGVSVIKVFNNISTYSLKYMASKDKRRRIALPVAGDDVAAKTIVFDLVDQIGFDPINAGSLSESWRQQPGTPVYGCDWNKKELLGKLLKADLTFSSIKVKQAFLLYGQAVKQYNKERGRNLSIVQVLIEGGAEFNAKIVAINRSLYK